MSSSASTCLPLPTSTPSLIISSPTAQRINYPIPSTFVRRNGSRLFLDGAEFKAVGGNVYWLGLDENVIPNPSYPSKSRVLEIMAIASAMGATTIRSTTLGISIGTPLSLQTGLNQFNPKAFEAIDFAIYAAKSYGLRLILPLTDQYDYYHGGIFTFLRMRGLQARSSSDFGPFYNLSGVVFGDFKNYVQMLIGHRSNLTGLTMAEEPTILAFETGNELGGFQMNAFPPPVEWTTSISQYLKTIAPDTLVISGSYGVREVELGIDRVDIYSDHYYPPYANRLKQSASLASNHNKVFLVGEFDWTNKYYQPLVYLAVLIPALLAISIWFMPSRWWPWRVNLDCCGCGKRKKSRRGKVELEEDYKEVENPDVTSSNLGRESQDQLNSSFPPSTSINQPSKKSSNRFGFQIRRYQFSLFILLFSPILAGIIYSYLPTPLNSFLSNIESLSSSGQLSGSFYWSLFGRDNSCCNYVQHNDGFTLHYPTTTSSIDSNMQSRILELVGHAWRMRGINPIWLSGGNWNSLGIEGLPSVSCPQIALSIPVNATWSSGNGTIGVS